MKENFLDRSLAYLFPLFTAIFLLQALGISNVYTPWVFTIYYVFYGYICFKKIPSNHPIKILLLIWFLYIVLSGLLANVSTKYMNEEFKRFMAPVLFCYVGMYISNNKFYKTFVYSIFFSVVVGFLLLIVRPAWYINFLVDCFNNSWFSRSAENASSIISAAFRFQSFYSDSYAISYFVSFSLCIVMCDIYRVNRIIKKRKILYSMFISFVIAVILSGFRVAIVYMILLFIWMLFYGIVTRNSNAKLFIRTFFIIFLFFSIVLIFFSNNSYVSMMKESLLDRFADFSYETAMEGSRNTQQEIVLDSWNNIIFGDGSGSKGAQARIDGLPAITDGGYIKMLVENGIVGVCLFALLMFKTIQRGLKNLRYFMMELMIISYVLISMLGANSLAMHWCFILPFWYSVGCIWNEKLLEDRILNKEYI